MAFYIDANGYILGEYSGDNKDEDGNDVIDSTKLIATVPAPETHTPKWNSGTSQWDEDATQANIDKHIERLRVPYRQQIDDAAEKVRLTYHTFGASMARTYDRKTTEAIAWDADNEASTPIIDAEIARTGEAKQTLVTAIITNDTDWKGSLGDIEGIRRKEKSNVDTATTVQAMIDAVDQARSDLDGFAS